MKNKKSSLLLLLCCVLLPAIFFCLPGAVDSYAGLWIFKLWIPLAIADLIFTAALFISANRFPWWVSLLTAGLGTVTATMTGVVPGLGFFLAYLLGSLTYVLLGHFMKKEDIRVRVAGPLFGKFVVVWLIARQMVLPMMNADADFVNTVQYMIAAPHVVTCLLGSLLGAGVLHLSSPQKKSQKALPSTFSKSGEKKEPPAI